MTAHIVYSAGRGAKVHETVSVEVAPLGKAFLKPYGDFITVHGVFETRHDADEWKRQFVLLHRLEPKEPLKHKNVKVKCLTNGKTYKNAVQAAAENGLSAGFLSSHLNNPRKHPTARGLVFKRVER